MQSRAERGEIFISNMTSTAVPGRGAGGATDRAGGGQKYLVVSEGAVRPEVTAVRVLLLYGRTMPKPGAQEAEIPLPPGWDFCRDYDNKLYFIDHNTQKTTWIDPRDR